MTRAILDPGFSVSDADELYSIRSWSNGYFGIAPAGDLTVSARGRVPIAVRDIVDRLSNEGHQLPMALRFQDILEDRIDKVNEAFAASIAEAGYSNTYQGVYPIKVNQRRVVVETIAAYGAKWRTGLEAGSKAAFGARLWR